MYKVLKTFIDIETKEKHKKESEYKPPSQKRAKELVKKGFLEEVKQTSKKDGKHESGES